ncbi:MAG: glycosyltransferase family 4 protein, partial [Solirubrobacteraceae bacterium]
EGMLAPAALPSAPEERILFFGDWRRSKGLPELMRAFDRLHERRPAARLTIAGTPYRDADPEAVRAWARGHGDAVTVIDRYVPIEDLPRLFGDARVVATPYVAGSQSGVLHLAMSFGRAVVCSDVGELGATVSDGETGRVVPAGDVEALVGALEAVIGDPAEAERLGRAARAWMLAEAGWDRVAARVEQELQALAASNGTRFR